MKRWGLALVALIAASRASAQSPAPFTLDPVMVPWIYADTPALKDIARDLRVDLENTIGGNYLVVPLSTVPDYDDYPASVYLDSCREDGQIECGYVIGARGQASWVVVGQLDASSPGRPPQVLFSIVDVAEAREVTSFTSSVTPDNHQAIADGLSLVLDQVLAGAVQLSDDRSAGRAMWELREQAREERQERQAEADAIDRSGTLDDLTRTLMEREDERITMRDLEQYQGRDDGTPWARVGLGRREYVRYRNSGKSIEDWRALSRGRLGQIRARGILGFGSGPYHHTYDGRYVLSAQDLQTVAVESFQQLSGGGGSLFGLELGLGVTPWLDVNVGIATRSVRYTAVVYQEVQDEPGTVPRPIDIARSTVEYTGGVTVSPLPTFPVRPTGTAQIAVWNGSDVQYVLGLPPSLRAFPRPSSVFLRLAPGAEITLGDRVVLFSRVNINARLLGNTLEEERSGGDVLIQKAEEPTRPGPLGADWVFGIDIPIGPLFGKGESR